MILDILQVNGQQVGVWDNPNAPTKYGETPIYLAEAGGHTEIIDRQS